MSLEQYYRPSLVAERLDVCEETVMRLCRAGLLRSVKVGAQRRIPESAIEDYLEGKQERRVRASAAAIHRRKT